MRSDIFLSLKALRSLELIHRANSFAEASAGLNVTVEALHKQMAELERKLGIKLFKDKRTSAEMTREGKTLALSISDSFEAINRSLKAILPAPGTVVLKMSQTIAIDWAIPVLRKAGWLDKVTLIVDPNYHFRSADVAILYFSAAMERKSGHLLFEDVSLPMVSQELGREEDSLEDHITRLGIISGTHDCWDWRHYLAEAGLGDGILQRVRMHIADTDFTAIELAAAGVGVALAQERFVSMHRNRDAVVPVPDCSPKKIGEYRIVANNDRSETRSLVDLLSLACR